MSANAMIGIRLRDTLQKYESFAVHTKLLPDFLEAKEKKAIFANKKGLCQKKIKYYISSRSALNNIRRPTK
jgi:HKD family nuclease